MSRPPRLSTLSTAMLLAAIAVGADPSSAEATTIRQRDDAYEFTVPASRLVVAIPRGALTLGKIPPGEGR